MNELTNREWYQEIIDDCKRLGEETDIRSRWEIGNNLLRIIDRPRKEKYGKKYIPEIARRLGVSARYLYLCIQFRVTYPDLSIFPGGTSWNKILTKYLIKKDKNFPLTTEEILSEEAHIVKVGICPICKTENGVFFVELIEHHICYKPKYTILVCRSCHRKCHTQVTQIGGGI